MKTLQNHQGRTDLISPTAGARNEGSSEITLLLKLVGCPTGPTSNELLPLVYDELRSLAAAKIAHESCGQTLQATALVHEAWLRLTQGGDRRWHDRIHFFRTAALAMRRILVDRARHRASLKAGGNQERLDIGAIDLCEIAPNDRILLIEEALTRFELEDPEGAHIVTLKFFGGFTNREIAEAEGITERTVERRWVHARAVLFKIIRRSEFPD